MSNDPIEIYSNVSFGLEVGKSNEQIFLKQELAFKYLDYLNKPLVILKDQKALDALKYTYVNSFMIKSPDIAKLSLKFKFAKICIDVLKHLYEIISKIIDSNPLNLIDDATNSKHLSSTLMLTAILNSFTNYSTKFCDEIHRFDGLKPIFDFLSNKNILDYYIQISKNQIDQKFVLINGVMRALLGALLNLTKVHYLHKQVWKDSKAVLKLQNYLCAEDIVDNKIAVHITLANIVDDDELVVLTESKDILKSITKIIGKCSESIETQKYLNRTKVQVGENELEEKLICSVIESGTEWNLIELTKALYHMALTDRMKYDIYSEYHIDKYLRTIIFNGNNDEKEVSLGLLWQLCFERRVGLDVLNDAKLSNYIRDLLKSGIDSIVKNCAGILWLIEGSKLKSLDDHKEEKFKLLRGISNLKASKSKHVMISYNKESRDLCLSIKKELQKRGS